MGLHGPGQAGRGVRGQYVYAFVMPQPTDETIREQGVKHRSDFNRIGLLELVVKDPRAFR